MEFIGDFFQFILTHYAWSAFPQVVQKQTLGKMETKTLI